MFIPVVGCCLFIIYNLWNYDVWLDKRTPLHPSERMSRSKQSKPRLLVSACHKFCGTESAWGEGVVDAATVRSIAHHTVIGDHDLTGPTVGLQVMITLTFILSHIDILLKVGVDFVRCNMTSLQTKATKI